MATESTRRVVAPVTFEAATPRVTLRNYFAHPYDSAIAAARTCYAPRLIGAEEITDKQRLMIGAATFYAEQQSQRYVRLDHASAYLPAADPGFGAAEEDIYRRAVERAWQSYRDIGAVLVDDARAILGDIWHLSSLSHPKRVEKVERQAEKRAIEVARYVLPVAAATTMVHTLSGIVLHRLWRMAAASDTPTEARFVIGEMVERVREVDPQFFDRFETEPMDEPPEWTTARRAADGEAQSREFDTRLNGRTSRLVDYSLMAPRVLAEAYRAVVGVTEAECSDAEALDRMLNPARNPYRLETMNVGVHAPLMRPLQHANFTFAKKLSHTADSQDQRHRMVPGSRPLLVLTDTAAPDFLVPMLIAGNARAREVYEKAMADAWAAKNELLDRGVPAEFALYLLPNAKVIR